MTAADNAIVQQVVYRNLFGMRIFGLAMIAFGWLPALALVSDELSRMRGGNEWNTAAWIAAGVLIVIGASGVMLFIKGRHVTASPLYKQLTTGASSIQTLQFVRFLNRPFVQVLLGVGGAKPTTVVYYGTAEDALVLFARIAPQATILPVPDRRKPASGPSPYAR